MTLFDTLFYTVFVFYKPKLKQKSTSVAVIYITILQLSFLLLLGVFFAGFFRQMNMVTVSSTKAWALFALIAIFIYFKNWMQYTGKRRMMINAKMSKKKLKTSSNIYMLWFLPVAVLSLTYVLFQAV